jgi:hypothetical protein
MIDMYFYYVLQVTEVLQVGDGSPVRFSVDIDFSTEKYEIV